MSALGGSMQVVLDTVGSMADTLRPFQFDLLNAQVTSWSFEVGFAPDQLRYVICLFLAYPFAVLYNTLPYAWTKHWFSIATGGFMAQFVLASGWVHSFITATVTYCIVKYGPERYAPQMVFVFNMMYLSISHLYRLYVDYMGWTLDFTGPQMLLLIKLTSFAYNYYDGVVAGSEENFKVRPNVQASRAKYAVKKLPSLLEFYGYVYCFTTFLAGPAFEYREYIDVVQNTKFIHQGRSMRPSCVGPALKKLAIGLFFMTLIGLFGSTFTLDKAITMESTHSMLSTLMTRTVYIYIALLLTRAKYYFAWKVAEGSTILCGFGFEGYDADGTCKDFNALGNVDILGFEFGQSIRDLSRAWNKGTQAWLERYVYSRTNNSLLATYFCSAFWHGFYPGYYIFFLTVPLATAVNRLAHKVLRPYFLPSAEPISSDNTNTWTKLFYDFSSLLGTQLFINYLAMAFVALSWSKSMEALQSVYFSGHIVLVAMYIILSIMPRCTESASNRSLKKKN